MTVEWTSGAHLEVEDPVMIVAFEGWNDAADVATGAIEHLELQWESRVVGQISGDDYFDYAEHRPIVHTTKGIQRGVEWPSITISICRPDTLDHDVVLVRGPEPGLRWQSFAQLFVDLVDVLDVSQVVLLGAYLGDVPHTRPTPLSGSAYSRRRVSEMGVTPSDYDGPTGIPGVLQQVLTTAGIPAVSLWAGVPHYVAAPPNPQGTEAVLSWLAETLGIGVPMDALRAQAASWRSRIDAAAAEDEDLAEYVRSLEARLDEDADPTTDPEPDREGAADGVAMRLVDGDELAAEFERYLRGDGEGPQGRS